MFKSIWEHVGVHEPCVCLNNPAYTLSNPLERTYEPCVPTCTQTLSNISHIDYQRLTPCAPIAAILHGEMGHIAR